ncbi:heme-binding protein [Bosea sp. BK604]|uniref:GlcG/HbpS family heme-binding protein n=1 Tax=Bosea sp. BK604 TaxID=2512180 RepID=UPI001051F88E|nr:heme-binding protein [Bosea sp. BK604]TCR62298.1 glc operon protein GlcG [Bosea sp. BK604]
MSSQPSKPVLTRQQVQAALDAGEATARTAGVRVSLAVVDDGGHLLGFVRMDGVHTGTVEVAQAKARCAAGFRKPTREMAQSLAAGMSALLTLPGSLPIPGGVPVRIGEQVAGAIGVSGASPDTDDEIARAAEAAAANYQ